jgi:glycosyltransferase involved in cell wall biosynthesis
MQTRIAVDARPAAYAEKTGIGYYTWHLLQHFPKVDPASTYVAWYLNFGRLMGRRDDRFGDRIPKEIEERSTPFPARWFERLSERFDAPRVEWFVRFDVLFAPNFVPPPTHTRRLVLTVHDLAFKLFPETAPQSTRWWLARIDRALAQAARIIAVSEATRRDLIELYEVPDDRVTVIPHGVDHDVFRPPRAADVAAVRSRFGIGTTPYLVVLGGIEPRKNLQRLVEAFARLPSDLEVTLVLAGGRTAWNPEGWDLLRLAIEGLPAEIRRRLVITGYVTEKEKVSLLGGSEALVYPSLYEGFGLPVLEAMACGAPVLTSNVSALPEVAGDAAMLVDPTDSAAIEDGMERLIRDDGLRARLRTAGRERALGFDWAATARRTAAVLHEA